MRRVFFMCLALMVVPFAVLAEELVPSITVTGEGRVTTVPDMAEITLGVTAQSKEASDAMDEASAITQKIFDLMPGFSIEPVDVQTSDLSLNPVWDRQGAQQNAPRIVGYQASNRVTVRVRDLSLLGDVLGAVLDQGANRMDGLRFSVSDPAPLLERARQRAVADAMARAATFAGAAGVELGNVLSITEGGGAVVFPEAASFDMARSSSVPIAAGDTEISARVSMRFAISPK